jgi:hypothetical protein
MARPMSGALSRHAYRLKFNSQREGPLDRSLRRRDKAIAKLKADGPMASQRPRGMHLQSYERLMRDIAKEEEFFAVLARVRFGIEILPSGRRATASIFPGLSRSRLCRPAPPAASLTGGRTPLPGRRPCPCYPRSRLTGKVVPTCVCSPFALARTYHLALSRPLCGRRSGSTRIFPCPQDQKEGTFLARQNSRVSRSPVPPAYSGP